MLRPFKSIPTFIYFNDYICFDLKIHELILSLDENL